MKETARKIHEELVAHRKAGEANITIRRGKIVSFDIGVQLGRGQVFCYVGGDCIYIRVDKQ